jgi:hypothetical protein
MAREVPIEGTAMKDYEIYRERVFGWVVIESGTDDQGRKRVEYRSLRHPVNYHLGYIPLEPDEKVVAVLPAEPGTFAVWADRNGRDRLLGHEHPDAKHQDWEWKMEADLRSAREARP